MRLTGGISTFILTHDAQNRLTTVSGATSASFVYDGDGNRVKSVMGGVTTYYIGNYYEYINSSTMKKYYYAGSQRVAMRDNNTLYFLLGDHLGSTAITANSNGTLYTEQRYYPWGDTRYNSPATTPTAYQYTGQRNDATGLYFYNARYYDPYLSRFIQADSIVPGAASGSGGGAATLGYDSNTRLTPLTVNLGEFAAQVNAENREVLQFGAFFQWDGKTRQEHNVPMGPVNPQALNRYAYCLNNPLRYVDPTGHSEYVWHFTTTPEELGHYIVLLENMKSRVEQFAAGFALAGVVASAIGGPAGWAFGVGCEVIAGYHALANAEFEAVINYLEQAQLTSTSDTIHIGVFFDEFGIPYVMVNNGVEADSAQAMLLSGEFFYNVFAHPERFTDVGSPPGDDTEWLVKETWPVPWRQE